MKMIVIVDIGMGNVGSILNMLKTIKANAIVSSKVDDIEKADKLVLPGVGAFDNAMENLKERGLIPVLEKKILRDGTPILGICLGVQLFTKKSEEGKLPGLGWIDAETKRFNFGSNHENLKIPHMGWNMVDIKEDSKLFEDMYPDARFYFVHSYHLVCKDKRDVLSTTRYGYDFVSSIRKGNIYGTQFHPEKSHKFGIKLYKNFVELC